MFSKMASCGIRRYFHGLPPLAAVYAGIDTPVTLKRNFAPAGYPSRSECVRLFFILRIGF